VITAYLCIYIITLSSLGLLLIHYIFYHNIVPLCFIWFSLWLYLLPRCSPQFTMYIVLMFCHCWVISILLGWRSLSFFNLLLLLDYLAGKSCLYQSFNFIHITGSSFDDNYTETLITPSLSHTRHTDVNVRFPCIQKPNHSLPTCRASVAEHF
jgi:hypothetical protein